MLFLEMEATVGRIIMESTRTAARGPIPDCAPGYFFAAGEQAPVSRRAVDDGGNPRQEIDELYVNPLYFFRTIMDHEDRRADA